MKFWKGKAVFTRSRWSVTLGRTRGAVYTPHALHTCEGFMSGHWIGGCNEAKHVRVSCLVASYRCAHLSCEPAPLGCTWRGGPCASIELPTP
ncbi:hypothetical protein VZT92_000858 [Zoarces viviparus]|uniref:Uncharacterized protein n=1 Tax=Zoarces viviparus TaxID=48416 RepID=A0AAW1G8A5_ZOAVI